MEWEVDRNMVQGLRRDELQSNTLPDQGLELVIGSSSMVSSCCGRYPFWYRRLASSQAYQRSRKTCLIIFWVI